VSTSRAKGLSRKRLSYHHHPNPSVRLSSAKQSLGCLKIHNDGVIAHPSFAEFTIYSSSRSGLYRVYLNGWTKLRCKFATRKQYVYEHRPTNT